MRPCALDVYTGSDGEVTKAYYAELEKFDSIGLVALNLFRAQKCSKRAKGYRRRAHKESAYDRKNWSLEQLCQVLKLRGAELGIGYGWKQDLKTIGFEWVLYVDLPQGQVSFHSAVRLEGPDYAGDWDKTKLSAERILAFCDSVTGAIPGETVISILETPAVEIEETPVQDLDLETVEQGELF